jgi:hypothetical protein
MRKIIPNIAFLVVLSAPAFALGIDISMPNLTFPDSPVVQGTTAPVTLSTSDEPSR